MSVDLSNLPRPKAYSFLGETEYDRFAEQQFRQLDIMAQHGSIPAEWAATVLTAMASQSTIALSLEAIETLLQYADRALNGSTDYREKAILGEVANIYMQKTGVWLDLQSIAPPRLIADCDRVLI